MWPDWTSDLNKWDKIPGLGRIKKIIKDLWNCKRNSRERRFNITTVNIAIIGGKKEMGEVLKERKFAIMVLYQTRYKFSGDMKVHNDYKLLYIDSDNGKRRTMPKFWRYIIFNLALLF